MKLRSLFFMVCALLGGVVLSVHGCGGASPNGGSDGGGDDGNTLSGLGGAWVEGNGGTSGEGGIGGGAQGGNGGSSCGAPGTACCIGNECSGGGCCVSGICMAPGGSCVGLGSGVCSEGACGTCGGPGMPCCGTNPSTGTCTAPKTKCNAGTCTPCGALGSVCCTDSSGGGGTCDGAGVICSNNLCIACGTPGTGCCPGNTCGGLACCYTNICIGESTACGTTGGTCQAGRCSGCGGPGQPCCSSSCYDDLICKSGTCTSCGNVGESCCPTTNSAERCKAGNACSTTSGDGVCARCGGLGDICCSNNSCSEGCCSGGRCLAGTACTTPDASIQPDAPSGGGGSVGTGGKTGSGGIVGTGGKTGSGGIIGTGGTSSTTPGPCGDLIDDMEAGTGFICQGNDRAGHWFTYVDSYSSSSTISPAPGVVAKPTTSSRDTGKYAMHASGVFSEYAGIGLLLNNPVIGEHPGVYNASGYTGIKFWAKGTGDLQVDGQMAGTQSVDNGGTCTSSSYISNHASYTSLSSSWKQYSVSFSSLSGGKCGSSTVTFSSSAIWGFEFQPYNYYGDPDVSFDFWIDDVTFYK